jgi:glucose uptake protein
LHLSGWRFELSYLDVAVGVFVTMTVLAFTFGSLGYDSFTFLDDVLQAGKRNLAYGIAAGAVLNLGLMLLAAGISLIGMALAFLIGLGLATGVVALLAHIDSPHGSLAILSVGGACLAASLAAALTTHRWLSLCAEFHKMKSGEHRTLRPVVRWKGVVVSLAGGLLVGLSRPLIELARDPDIGVGPYSLGFLLGAGILGSAVFYELYFLNLPVRGRPLEPTEYLRGTWKQHAYGVLGGMVLAVGLIIPLILKASGQELEKPFALFFTAEHGAPLVAAVWGLVAWREFRHADGKVYAYFATALALFVAALILLGLGLTPRST